MMAGSLLRTDRITKKHSIKLIERATKKIDGCEQILYSRRTASARSSSGTMLGGNRARAHVM